MIISFHSIDQETAEPYHFFIDWIKGYWSNTQKCKMFFLLKSEKNMQYIWGKIQLSHYWNIEEQANKFWHQKSVTQSISEWLTRSLLSCPEHIEQNKRIRKYARPCSSDLRCASLSPLGCRYIWLFAELIICIFTQRNICIWVERVMHISDQMNRDEHIS